MLMGRDRELALLSRTLSGAGRGSGLTVVAGPAGIGRTALLGEAAASARAAGRAVAEYAGQPPAFPGMAAGRAPDAMVVCWDDPPWGSPELHWAMTRMPATWVLSFRTGETLPRLAPRLLGAWIELDPLGDSAVADLARLLLPATPDAELVSVLAIAGGNPGFVTELVGGLLHEGLVELTGDRARLRPSRLPNVTAVRILQTVGVLSPFGRHLVQVAAVAGRRCDLNLLASLLETSAVALVPALAEVTAAGILRADGEQLAFPHDLVRRLIEASLPGPVRAMVAERVRALGPGTPAPPSPLGVLTPAETRIAQLVRDGLTNQQVAHRLDVSPHTVNYHLRQIYRKLDVASRVELARLPWADPGEVRIPTQRRPQGASAAA